MITEKERQDFRKLTQQTPEWLCARRGRIPASRCAEVIGRTKDRVLKDGTVKPGNYSEKRYNFLLELLTEHLTGRAVERYVTPAMEWGIEQQPFAQAAYEMKMDCSVEEVGLIIHPELEYFCGSPDGLISADGIVEFKCPTTGTHIEYLKAGTVPEEYIPQMNAYLCLMPERDYCDFVSFDPRVPFGMQLFIRRHYRDRQRIAELEQEVKKFQAELAFELMELTKSRPVVTELVEAGG